MANPENPTRTRDVAPEETVDKDRQAEELLYANMERVNTMDREEAMKLAREKGLEKQAHDYFLIKDYCELLRKGDLKVENKHADDYTIEFQESYLRDLAKDGDWIEKVLANNTAAPAEESTLVETTPATTEGTTPAEETTPIETTTPAAAQEQAPQLESKEKKSSFKSKLGRRVLTGVLALAIFTGVGLNLDKAKNFIDNLRNNNTGIEDNDTFGDDATEGSDIGGEELTTVEQNMAKYYGEMNNYQAPGLFYEEDNGRFAKASVVHETLGEEATNKDILVAVSSQEEALADYIGSMPDEARPAGFEGMTILQVQEKFGDMTEVEKTEVWTEFKETIYSDTTTTEDTELNGTFQNAFMLEHGEGDLELVHCETVEHGTKATVFVFHSETGVETGRMIVKLDEDGEIGCVQAVTEEYHSFEGMTEVTVNEEEKITTITTTTITRRGEPDPGPDPENPDPDPGDPEDPGPDPEDPGPDPKDEVRNTEIEDNIDEADGGNNLSGGEVNTTEDNSETERPSWAGGSGGDNNASGGNNSGNSGNSGGSSGGSGGGNSGGESSGSSGGSGSESGGSSGGSGGSGGGGDSESGGSSGGTSGGSGGGESSGNSGGGGGGEMQNENATQADAGGGTVNIDWGNAE